MYFCYSKNIYCKQENMKKLLVLAFLCPLFTIPFYGEAYLKRNLKITGNYLNFPICTGVHGERMDFYVDGKKVREMLVELDAVHPNFWTNMNVTHWKGRTMELRLYNVKMKPSLDSICESEKPRGYENIYSEELRPKFHFTAMRGWLNDPNGLVYFSGRWHLFFQHNPYGWNWNNMTWGHAVSRDLVHWQEMGDALHPDENGTIFSGSCIIDHDNVLGLQRGKQKTLVAFFTYAGHSGHKWSDAAPTTQAMAYSLDGGTTWTKYEHNPVIPTICADNRDPKVVWDAVSHCWIMSLYLGDADKDHGFILLKSHNLLDWQELQRFSVPDERECPGFIPVKVEGSKEIKWIFSGANKVYVVGDFQNNRFTPLTAPKYMDLGANFYAAQTYFNAPDGRVVHIGWMSGSTFPSMPFNQQMSFPRELKLFHTSSGYELRSMPVRELSKLFSLSPFHLAHKEVSSADNPTQHFRGDSYVLDATFNVATGFAGEFGFLLDGFEVRYIAGKGKLLMGGSDKREVSLQPEQGKISLRILVDVGSVEVFANSGKVAAAFAYLPSVRTHRVDTQVKNGPVELQNLIIHPIRSTWLHK